MLYIRCRKNAGHMNVLLAEANISYEQLKDLDEINPEFEDCDVAIVLGQMML